MSEYESVKEMPRAIATELIRQWLQPNTPTLGMWFGWNQPTDNGNVKLGSAYGYVQPYTLRNVLDGADIDHETKQDLIQDAMSEFDVQDIEEMLDTTIEDNGLVMADEVFIDFNHLDNEQKALVRLKIMMVNTFTDGHNWACEYGDYLAQSYAYCSFTDKEFLAYEGCHQTTEDLLFHGVELDIYCSEGDYSRLEGSQQTQSWIDENNILDQLFSLPTYYTEVKEALSWAIDWIITEYESGNLTLSTDSPGIIGQFARQAEQLTYL